MIGTTVSHYNITGKLGTGGMGIVYRADDTSLKRPVALKFLPFDLSYDPEAKERFIVEAQAASSLDHINICNIHEVAETDEGRLYIVMAYYHGENLKEIIRRSGPLSIQTALEYSCQIARGLQYAHEHLIIHRDIKPANVIVTDEGIVKIVDFGLAKLLDTDQSFMTRTGRTMGTYAYMSPEQASGCETDHRTDIWALGVVLYEMLTGVLPFRGDYDAAVIYSILNEEPVPPRDFRPSVSPALEKVVLKALDKDPEERYQQVDEMLGELRALQEKPENAYRNILDTVERNSQSRAEELRRVVFAVLVFVLFIAGFYFLYPMLLSEPPPPEPVPIAVISFSNMTGDKNYDYLQEAIPNLLITNLEQSRSFTVATWERMNDLLRQMGRNGVKYIDSQTGFDLCRREGIDLIVIGSFMKAGDLFVTDVKVMDVNTKDIIYSTKSKGTGVASIINNQIDVLSNNISREIRSTGQSTTEGNVKLRDVTTSSMDAYNYFIRGRTDYEKFYYSDALKFLEKSIQEDTTFAAAYLTMSFIYSIYSEKEKSISALEKAKQYSSKATEREKLSIEASYARMVEQDSKKQLELLHQLAEKFPKEKRVFYELAANYRENSQPGEAIRYIRKALELDPLYAPAVNELAYEYMLTGQFDKALGYFKKYAEMNPGDANPFDSMGDMFWVTGNLDMAVENYSKAVSVKNDFFPSLWKLSYCYAMKGDFEKAQLWARNTVQAVPATAMKLNARWYECMLMYLSGRQSKALSALRAMHSNSGTNKHKSYYPPAMFLEAHIMLEQGKTKEAVRLIDSWLKEVLKSGENNKGILIDREFIHGMAAVKEGHLKSAAASLESIRNYNASLKYMEKPFRQLEEWLLDGELSLAEGNYDRAEKMFSMQHTSLMAVISMPFTAWYYNIPFSRDGLARTYLRAGKTQQAIQEYERLCGLDMKGQYRQIKYPKYYLLLSKLYEKQGNAVKAKENYDKYLAYK